MNPTIPRGVRATTIQFLLASAFGLACVLLVPHQALAQTDSCADVNGDGSVTTVDALMVLRKAVGVPIDFSCPEPGAAAVSGRTTAALEAGGCGDVSGDAKTTTVDALMILKYAIGLSVELKCATASTTRNLIRYLNNLTCKGDVFVSTVEVLPSGKKWKSRSGVESEYKPWEEETIGDRFVVSTGECGDVELFGTINLPENVRVMMRLGLDIFRRPQLEFLDEGPISSLISGDDAPPFAVLHVVLPAGMELSPVD